MYGYLDGDIPVQTPWIISLGVNPAQTIVLTHHTGFAYDCSRMYSLWNEVQAALGNDPFAWYWGHVHNGIVYDAPVKIPASATQPTPFTTNTYARCLGHGALPYGYASAIAGNPNIFWQEGNDQSVGVLPNGFVLLTLTADSHTGLIKTITEEFYNLGTADPVFSKTIYGG